MKYNGNETHQKEVELPIGQSIKFFFGNYNEPYKCRIGAFYCNASDLISITPITNPCVEEPEDMSEPAHTLGALGD
jgi:hypothetical protein